MNKMFWNDIATKGAMLGLLMLASHVFETAAMISGSTGMILTAGIECIVAAVAYVWLLFRFTKRASFKLGSREKGFSYAQGLLYAIWVSLFAGIVVGLGNYLYLHYFVGYDNYVEWMMTEVRQVMHSMKSMPSMAAAYNNMQLTLSALAERPEPNVFESISSSIFSYCIWGLIVGLFVAGMTKRQPDIFNEKEN